MKFGTFDISNISISILMSKMIFIKCLPPVRPKLVPELKVPRIYLNLAHSIFEIRQSQFWCEKCFFIKNLPVAWPRLVPNWNTLRIYRNLVELIFQICWSQFWCQKWFLLNIYHLLGQNWSRIKSVQNLLKFDAFNISIMLISI